MNQVTPELAAPSAAPAAGKREALYRGLAIVLMLLVFGYACVRAYRLSLTHDEALSWGIASLYAYPGIVTYQYPSPNNHLLNTLLIRLLTHTLHLPMTEFVIRLPALLGHALYLVGIYFALRLVLRGPRFLLGVGLLCLHPLLLDFFSCARGYSLALGFMSWGLFFCLKHLQELPRNCSPRYLTWAMVWLAFATLSNLIFLNVFIAVACVFLPLGIAALVARAQTGSVNFKDFARRILVPFGLTTIGLLAVYAYPVIMLHKWHAFNWGEAGRQGFWADTLNSLVDTTLHGHAYVKADWFVPLLSYLAVAVFLLVIFSTLFYHLWTRAPLAGYSPVYFAAAIIAVSFLIVQAQHFILDASYPTDRQAIYFIPLFLLLIMLAGQTLRGVGSRVGRIMIDAAFQVPLMIVILHFLLCLNTSYYYSWRYDAHTKEAVGDFAELTATERAKSMTVTLSASWALSSAVNYYLVKNKITSVSSEQMLTWFSNPDGYFDYYYLGPEDKQLIEKYQLKIIKTYDVSGACLCILPEESRQAVRYYNAAEALYAKGQLDEAITQYVQALALNAEFAPAQNNLAATLLSKNRVDEALLHFREAVKAAPEWAEAHYNLAKALAQKGDLEASIAEYSRSLQLRPEFAEAHYNLAGMLLAAGNTEEAISHYRRALEIKPDFSEACSNLGMVYLDQGKFAEALSAYQQAVKLKNENAAGWAGLCMVYSKLNKPELAQQALRRLEQLDPDRAQQLKSLFSLPSPPY